MIKLSKCPYCKGTGGKPFVCLNCEGLGKVKK